MTAYNVISLALGLGVGVGAGIALTALVELYLDARRKAKQAQP